MKKYFLIFIPFWLAGCSTYSQNDCLNFNWYDEGFRSAMQGDTAVEKTAHFKRECGYENQVEMNEEKFQLGYKKGLDIFCSSDGGRQLGQSGKRYKGTCPRTAEEPFLKSYDSGRLDFLVSKVSDLEKTVSSLRSELSSKDSKINSLESEISTLRARSCP
jgi:Protein of unknown function (DUF2799)